jgi:serine/threonine-protein kinase RsbW
VSDRELQLALPAHAQNVIVVRQAVAGLGEALGLAPHRVDDLKTVITEACNNVVLHAYEEGEEGGLEVTAAASESAIELEVRDHGRGFQPGTGVHDERSLGLGLPLIASLSDHFQISGGAGEGTRMRMRFDLAEAGQASTNGDHASVGSEELALQISGGEMVRPVLARVIGALAARAQFSVDRLADTVLIGDAVSAHGADDFSSGRVEISIKDGDGTLDVRVGPLVEGGGERILAEMDVPEGGSLRGLARSMEVETGKAPDGSSAEFLVFEVVS